jgi:hypothetical protein
VPQRSVLSPTLYWIDVAEDRGQCISVVNSVSDAQLVASLEGLSCKELVTYCLFVDFPLVYRQSRNEYQKH